MAAVLAPPIVAAPVRQAAHWSDRVAQLALVLVALALTAFLALPLATILLHAVQDKQGDFAGIDNFIEYAKSPSLLGSLWNSLWVSAAVTVIAVPLAFAFAYAMARSCM